MDVVGAQHQAPGVQAEALDGGDYLRPFLGRQPVDARCQQHPHTPAELFDHLGGGFRHVRVLHAGHQGGVQHRAGEAGELSADGLVALDGRLDLAQLLPVGAQQQRRVDVAAEAHRLGAVQHRQCRSDVHGVARGLEIGRHGRYACGNPQEEVQRQVGGLGDEEVDAGGSQHVGDLVGIRTNREDTPGHDGAGQLGDGDVGTLQVHVRIDEPRRHEAPAGLEDLGVGTDQLLTAVAHRGDAPGSHHHVGGNDLAGEDVHHPPAGEHCVGRLVAQRHTDQPPAHLGGHVQNGGGHEPRVPTPLTAVATGEAPRPVVAPTRTSHGDRTSHAVFPARPAQRPAVS